MVVVPPHCSCRPPRRCRPSSPLLSSLVLVVVLVIHGLCPLPAVGRPSGFCRLCRALLGLSSRLPPRFLTPFLVFLVVSGAPLVAFVSAHCGSGIVLVVLVLPGIVWSRLGALGLLWRWWRWSCHCHHLRCCGGSRGGGGSFASPSPACSLVLLLLHWYSSCCGIVPCRRFRHSCPPGGVIPVFPGLVLSLLLVVRSISVVAERRHRHCGGRSTLLGISIIEIPEIEHKIC
jgi:hypothetical protein